MIKPLFSIILLLLLLGCSDSKDASSIDINIQDPDKSNSRTSDYSETKHAYFGDVHIHTSWSFDAFIYNVRTNPDDAYEYAKGKSIPHVSGKDIQIQRPLDFLAVSDHSEYMGVMVQTADEDSPLSQLDIAKRINDSDAKVSREAFNEIGNSIATNEPIDALVQKDILKSTWQRIVESADRHYEPGKFTTFSAYEWTSSVGEVDSIPQYARNLHRNIIYKSSKVSEIPFSSFDSQNPEDLWKWMDVQREQGIELLAIPHNGNISDGSMYALKTANGHALNLEYAQTRMRNEPINEVIQIKGQSMAHPALAPNDEFANFEIYQHTLGRGEPRKQSNPDGSFVRKAFKDGLKIEQEIGANPFQFGVIGSSDTHNSASNVEEDNNIGKSGLQDPTPKRRMAKTRASARNRQAAVGGLAGVWATQNTRESIFESFENKEVYATSGTRIKVRFFGGWDLENVNFDGDEWISNSYKKGVPMGSVLPSSESKDNAPSFVIWAVKDVEGANLDRIQVIKGWVDENGQTHEKIIDVVWSDDREMSATGNLPSVGNTVDLTTASYTNDIGAVSLQAVWADPDFDKDHSAFYYLRVLEIPTPRWTTYDAVKLGVELPSEVPPTIQERAWSSPIWFNPTLL